MTDLYFSRRAFMSVFSALALMAMIVRGMVPAGYMVAPSSESGQFVDIVICHGDGSEFTRALLNLKTGKLADPSDEKGQPDAGKHSACPFATTAHFPLPDAAQKFAQPDRADDSGPSLLAYVILGRGLAAPPPPARAPPIFF